MRILKLKLRGAIGIKKGLGLDQVEIDFTQFQPGLIALTGRNGSGKTTIMENLHPYRRMVSRDGSLQSHFFLKDSFRVLEFEMNGITYESKILIDALTGASEAYLQCYENGSYWVVLNDGKLTTYDEELEKVIGSADLFFSSVFSGQKSKGIAELKPAERRKLFYELLNLNIYENYLESAKTNLKKEENKLADLEGQIKALQEKQEDLSALETEKVLTAEKITVLNQDMEFFEQETARLNEVIKNLEIQIGTSENQLKVNEDTERRIQSLSSQIDRITKEHNSKVTRYNSDIEDFRKIISRNQKLLGNQDNISAALQEKKELHDSLSTLNRQKSEVHAALSEIQNAYTKELQSISLKEKTLSEKLVEKISIENQIASKSRQEDRIQSDTGIISEVPCTEEIGTKCRFLQIAYKSKEELPELQQLIKDLHKDLVIKKEQILSLEKEIKSAKQIAEEQYNLKIKDKNDNLTAVSLSIRNKESRFIELSKTDWEKLQEESKQAENNITLLNQKIESTNSLIEEAKKTFDNELSRIKSELSEFQAKLDSELPAKIKKLKSDLYAERVKQSDNNDDLKRVRSSLEITTGKLNVINEKISQLKSTADKIIKLVCDKSLVESEIKDWSFLIRAFDKTGIPVLKLENSGIEITTVANELLSLFENKFRIVFETTSLTKDKKKMKETFDINIVEEDGVCEIGNKSGGQQVWLETAIQLAISLVVRQQGRNIQTSFLDEKDGALDLENAYSYIEMLKKAHQLSGVHNTFIITHRPELLDFIPQQVRLIDGYLQILN